MSAERIAYIPMGENEDLLEVRFDFYPTFKEAVDAGRRYVDDGTYDTTCFTVYEVALRNPRTFKMALQEVK